MRARGGRFIGGIARNVQVHTSSHPGLVTFTTRTSLKHFCSVVCFEFPVYYVRLLTSLKVLCFCDDVFCFLQ
ncbi:hypothetical protein ES319_D07G164800v1 [Gossypium barbadense]|uniref:Uncharacterized protein n=1 Tax=Gossypium barbadense TaxID=3634 RepID=A0A5J5QUY7_GOSBA|nr:hypothetical protein ES319_D07G164800v1 [Gossypium barbadense]